MKQLIESVVILVDTREKINSHLIEYFDKQNIKHKTSLMKKIGVKDFILFLVGCSKSNGSNLIELSRRITLSSLSCDTLIKMNINQQKLIKILNETQKEEFKHMKPELIKQIEQRYMIFSVLIAKSIEEVNKKQ